LEKLSDEVANHEHSKELLEILHQQKEDQEADKPNRRRPRRRRRPL
jgi:hypothetical protein